MGRWQESKWEHMAAALEKNPNLPRVGCIQHEKGHEPSCAFCLRATIVGLKPWSEPRANMRSPYDR